MSKRNKLVKFNDLLHADNVYENFNPKSNVLTIAENKELVMKGKWNDLHFKNDQAITLELACGRGEYAIGLAKKHSGRNFIGVDVKGARIWQGSTTAKENNLDNVAFLRTRIEFIDEFFEKNEVEQLWITFADPFVKERKENRRLSALGFLDRYANILKKDGLLNIKTDSPILYYYSLDTLSEHKRFRILYHDADIYRAPFLMDDLEIKTYYEQDHLKKNKTIKFIQAQLID